MVVKTIVSLLPNIAMTFSIYNLFYFEYQSTGLSIEAASKIYQNYSFNIGLVMLFIDIIWFLLLGLYCD